MRATLLAFIAVTALTFGCSKKTAPEPEAAAADPAPGANKQDYTMVAASLEDLDKKVQQQQYDAAVGALVGLAQMPKTDAQEAQFRAKLRQTENELNKRAVAGDPAAQQSAQMLGRIMTGR